MESPRPSDTLKKLEKIMICIAIPHGPIEYWVMTLNLSIMCNNVFDLDDLDDIVSGVIDYIDFVFSVMSNKY